MASPARDLNGTSVPSPPAPAPRQRIAMEVDDDFFMQAMIQDAEEEQPPEEEDEGDDDLYAPVASTSRAPTKVQEVPAVVAKGSEVKEGKKRLVMELAEGFGDEDEDDAAMESVVSERRQAPVAPLAARYGDLSSVNLALSSNYIEAAPISATTFDGHKFILKRRKRIDSALNSAVEAAQNSAALAKLAGSMLEVPYHRMVDTIKSDTLNAKKQAFADESNPEMEEHRPPTDGTLWTDRYRPKKFMDLLGDERVHRSALLWLKEWDQCVFKGSAKTSAAAALKKERMKKRAREGKFDTATPAGEEEKAPDPYGRPQEKILLLCGPPGLGKTTLAYVLARQAGYQVLEVNASDDRSGKIVEDRIRNALESRALTTNAGLEGSRPTCVIIDEIDGAGGGGETSFIRTLVKLVMEGSLLRKYKGKGKKDRPLLRPIICICNDLYAPVLRPLRPLARIIRFTPPTNVMLVKRLRTICDEEGLGADAKNLTMLAEVAEGDLRSCLNTLQFIKRKSKFVDVEAIRSTVVGMKDTGTSSTVVIDRLFKKPPRKKGASTSDDRYLNRIVRDVQTCGEYEKISQGCFENYLGAKQMNDGWSRILEAHDWLFLYDRLDSRLRSDRDYELLAYVPYTFVPWYKLFSSHTAKALEFPKSDYEAFLKRTAHQEIIDAFKSTIPQQLKTLFTGTNIAAELLPYINRIICPDLKPLNSQLIKTEERTIMLKLINTLIGMKLNFVHDKSEDGQLTYKIDPPIDVFVHFEGKRASDIAPSRYAVRHLIVREMEAELVRRTAGEGIVHTARDIIAAYNLKPEANKSEMKEAIDFFGRTIVVKVTSEDIDAPTPTKVVQTAVYRFNEGFSNAVRVTKRVGDFLL